MLNNNKKPGRKLAGNQSEDLEEKIGRLFNADLSAAIKGIRKMKKGTATKKKKKSRFNNNSLIVFSLLILAVGFFFGSAFGDEFSQALKNLVQQPLQEVQGPSFLPPIGETGSYVAKSDQEEAVIEVVEKASPAVVSIVVTKEVTVFEEYYENPFEDLFGPGVPDDFFGPGVPEFGVPRYREKGTEKQEVGGGTGFVISEDGLVLTNKHVVFETDAEYTVITNEGERYTAYVLARDPFQDLAILKIEAKKDGERGSLGNFRVLRLGDSSKVQIGQTVIAIGNALGEFRNTVSVGVISGLGRRITASGGGMVETLEDVIQTDAAINKGNSGGPLLNLRGEVIGVNVAIAEAAQSISFSIPINKAKRDIEQVKTIGKIVYPFLGVRYILLTPEIQEAKDLFADQGAWIVAGETVEEVAVVPGSGADEAGLREGDIILEVDGEEISLQNSLAKMIQEHKPGDTIVLRVLRGEQELIIEAVLGEMSSEESD